MPRSLRLLSAALLSGWLCLAALAAPPAGVTFYAGYEQTLDGVTPAGRLKGDPGGVAAAFQDGLRGSALLAGDGGPFVKYPGSGVVDAAEGSVEVWVQSLNWTLPAWGFHVFFRADGDPSGMMLLYKFGHAGGRFIAYVSGPGLKSPLTSGDPPVRWVPNKWRQFVMTWDSRNVTFYLDGVPCRPSEDAKPFGFQVKSFSIGDDPWASAASGAKIPEFKASATDRNAKTLVDEVYVYGRALTSEEVAWAFENALTRKPGQDIPAGVGPVARLFDVTPRPDSKRIGFDVTVAPRFREEAAVCRVEIIQPAGLKTSSDVPFAGKDAVSGELPCASFPPGRYDLRATILNAAGKVVGSREASFEAPAPPVWRGNRLGFSDTPPAPYTPVAPLKEGAGFTCLGRTVTFDGMGFVRSAVANGQETLSAPMRLVARQAGKDTVWRNQRIEVKERDANRIAWTSCAESSLGRLEAVITAEYDGMIRYDLTLTPEAAQTVDTLELELPVRRECATLNYLPVTSSGAIYESFADWLAGGDKDRPRQVTASADRIECPWVSYAWLGNEDVGISTLVESDEAWNKADRKDAFRLQRSAGAVKMVMSFCNEAWTLPGPWRLTVGVQPTPVKTLVPRGLWRLGRDKESVPGANFSIHWTNPKEMPAFGYPGVLSPAEFLGVVDAANARGVGLVPYSLLSQFSISAPEYPFYFAKLRSPGSKLYMMGLSAFGADEALARIAPARDYIDYQVWMNHQWMTQCKLAGVYHDLATVYDFVLPEQGLGYQRDGAWRPAYPIFGVRELHRRMYTMTRALEAADGKPRLSIIHGPPYAWLAAFCDFNWVGEYAKEDYRRRLRPDAEMKTHAGHSVGARCLWLPQHAATRCHPRQPGGPEQPSRYLAGLTLLHDMSLSPNYMNEAVLKEFYTTLDKFGNLSETRFVPHWKSPGLKTAGQNVFCSAYVREAAQGGVLLCVVNASDKAQAAEVAVDEAALGAGPLSVAADLSSGNAVAFEKGCVRVEIGPFEYRLLWLK